jgi:hypothetical protein
MFAVAKWLRLSARLTEVRMRLGFVIIAISARTPSHAAVALRIPSVPAFPVATVTACHRRASQNFAISAAREKSIHGALTSM